MGVKRWEMEEIDKTSSRGALIYGRHGPQARLPEWIPQSRPVVGSIW
jgi:hypothetical protein